jgi:hypothetical protein
MPRFIKILQAVLLILPAVIEAIRAIEAAVPAGGKGADKLQLLRELIAGVYDAAGDVGITFSELWPTLERTVSGVVAMFNKSGVFKPSAAE